MKPYWKVPLYCMAASWICYQVKIRIGTWAIVTLPDGSVSFDNTRWAILCAVLFLAVVCLGGLSIFRKMTHREIFISASVLVILNIVLGIFTYFTQRTFTSFTILWSELTEWDSVFTYITMRFDFNEWVSAAITWGLPPYVFVLFGRKESSLPD